MALLHTDGFPIVTFKSVQAWRSWLAANGEKQKSVWLRIFKKDTGIDTVTYPEAVDEAICFGWIDSKINKYDDQSFLQYFAQRNPKSNWSAVNKRKVEQLMKQNRMAPQGLAMIALAKKMGTWTALDKVSNLELPTELQAAFDRNTKAYLFWQDFPPSTKRGILEWINAAKQPETKMKRINETVRLAAKNERANQYKPKQ